MLGGSVEDCAPVGPLSLRLTWWCKDETGELINAPLALTLKWQLCGVAAECSTLIGVDLDVVAS